MPEKVPLREWFFVWSGGYLGWAIFAFLAGAILGCAVGVFLGGLASEQSAYSKQYREERQDIEPLLERDAAFREIRCSQRSNGGVSLSGSVPTQADWDRLRELPVRAFGERRAEKLMSGLRVPT